RPPRATRTRARSTKRRRRQRLRVAHVAAWHALGDARRRAVAEVALDRDAAAAVTVDEPPDRAIGGPARPLRLAGRGLLDEVDVQPLVAPGREQQAARGLAVATGSAGLLVVGLERLGHRGVADRPHVRLVDPHAE